MAEENAKTEMIDADAVGRLLTQADLGYVLLTENGAIHHANRAAADLFHQEAADLLGQCLWDLLDRQHDEVQSEFLNWLEDSSSETNEVACTFRTQRNTTVPTIVCGGLLGGAPPSRRVGLTIRDISASEYIREMLKDGSLFAEVVDVLPVLRKNSRGQITYANHMFCQESGRAPGDVYLQTDFTLYPEALARQYREDDKHVLESGQQLEATELHEAAKGENPVGLERYVHVLKTRVVNAENEPEVVITYWRVAEREQVLVDLLRARTRHHQSLVKHIPFNIYRKDVDLRFSYASDKYVKHLNKTTREAVLGKTDGDFFPREQAEKYEADDRDVMSSREPKEFDEKHTDPATGELRYMRVIKTPLLDPANDELVGGLQGIFWDATKELKAEKQLRQLVYEKEVLAREVHHRVKNDMWTASSLLVEQAGQVKDTTSRTVLLESARRIEAMALVHQELYGSGELTHIDLAAYIDSLLCKIREAQTAPEKCAISILTQLTSVRVNMDDAIPCALVVNELISNAMKHAFLPDHQSPEVTVGLDNTASGDVVVTVADNGQGLSKNVTTDFSETFGLSMVYLLVKRQLKGSITSTNNGGARFDIQFRPTVVGCDVESHVSVHSKES